MLLSIRISKREKTIFFKIHSHPTEYPVNLYNK